MDSVKHKWGIMTQTLPETVRESSNWNLHFIGGTPASYLESPGFEYHPGEYLFWL